MKKKLLLILLAYMPLLMFAQTGEKNIVELNLSSLAFKNIHISYERKIHKKIVAVLGIRYMPETGLPYQNIFENYFNSTNINYGRFQMGNYAITPEVRFFMQKGMRGFYVAPYFRYAYFNLTIPVEYQTTINSQPVTKDADFAGHIVSYSGGIMLGAQYTIWKKWILDLWIIGGEYGGGNGHLSANIQPPMGIAEQASLQYAINTIDTYPFKLTGKVTSSTTAEMDGSGPWTGLRAFGINIGYRF